MLEPLPSAGHEEAGAIGDGRIIQAGFAVDHEGLAAGGRLVLRPGAWYWQAGIGPPARTRARQSAAGSSGHGASFSAGHAACRRWHPIGAPTMRSEGRPPPPGW
jgi:hypothetical protein